MPNDTTHLLNLTTSDGWGVALPVRLPDAITFDWFLPGRGIMSACVHPTSLDPASAQTGEVETWNPSLSREEKRKKQVRYYDEKEKRHGWRADTSLDLTAEEDATAREQAKEVLSFVVDRLTNPGMRRGTANPDPILGAIADMAHVEEVLRETWEKLPAVIRTRTVRPPPAGSPQATAALGWFVDVLTEEAQKAAATSARALLERKS